MNSNKTFTYLDAWFKWNVSRFSGFSLETYFQMVCNAIAGMKQHVYIPMLTWEARSVTAVGKIGLSINLRNTLSIDNVILFNPGTDNCCFTTLVQMAQSNWSRPWDSVQTCTLRPTLHKVASLGQMLCRLAPLGPILHGPSYNPGTSLCSWTQSRPCI